ncbi:hypothetical protein VTK73DRAFT_5183 [Phialemonium thermophilum]|uniref:Exocyst complex component Sec8 n=1 Tax=Phialemonium thermophilum TaxID=223376 RepID=A0ABR3WPL8_9PEZI
MEVRCRIVHSLHVVLSPSTAPYLLDQEVNEPDPEILSLNAELIAYDETTARLLRDAEARFVRIGLGLLVDTYLVRNAPSVAPINARGCGRMQLNILVLQQNLKNVEEGVDLARAANYYALLEKGADAVVARARENQARLAEGGGKEEGDSTLLPYAERFTYDELKALVELCYSEQLADPERGVAAQAKRQMADKLLSLSECMWQS